jgi:hypothetical protein
MSIKISSLSCICVLDAFVCELPLLFRVENDKSLISNLIDPLNQSVQVFDLLKNATITAASTVGWLSIDQKILGKAHYFTLSVTLY